MDQKNENAAHLDALKAAFARVAEAYDGAALTALVDGYSEAHRAYHAPRHIADLLEKFDDLAILAVREDLILHAILWHDVVYTTQEASGAPRSDALNVRMSADLFLKHAVHMGEDDRRAVEALIMATSGHRVPEDERYPGFRADVGLFLDLDLSSLAAPWPQFWRNTCDIRTEYAWVPHVDFCEKRAEILAAFAERPSLFYRAECAAMWDEAARANLRASAVKLRSLASLPASTLLAPTP